MSEPTDTATSRVVVNGVGTRVQQAGDATSPRAVLFVHGNPGPLEDWDFAFAAVAALDGVERVVAFDMPGYGEADRPRSLPYTIEGHVAWMDALLDELGVVEVHLVLHDFGGPWGLTWASTRQTRVRSVTLINTGVMIGLRWHKVAQLWQRPIVGPLVQVLTTRKRLGEALDGSNPKPLPAAFLDRMHGHSDRGNRRAVRTIYRETRDVGPRQEALAAALDAPSWPVLVLWGEADRFLPAKFAHQQTDHFPRAEVHLIPETGHWPFIDEPEAMKDHLIRFLSAVHQVDDTDA